MTIKQSAVAAAFNYNKGLLVLMQAEEAVAEKNLLDAEMAVLKARRCVRRVLDTVEIIEAKLADMNLTDEVRK